MYLNVQINSVQLMFIGTVYFYIMRFEKYITITINNNR